MMTAFANGALPENLFIRLSATDLCIARYDAEVHTAFAFSAFRLNPKISLTANLREAVRTEPLLKNYGEGCVQIVVNAPATFVPLAEFQEEDCEALYDLCFPKDKPRRVFYDVVASANCVVLFSLACATCYALEEAFGNVHYVSSLTPLIRHFSGKTGPRPGRKRFLVAAHEAAADIIVMEDGRLLMANTYSVQGAVDVAYFVLNVARQLGAAVASDEASAGAVVEDCVPLYVAGSETERQNVCAELRKYAGGVFPVNPSAEFNRHIVAATGGVPYDLITLLIG